MRFIPNLETHQKIAALRKASKKSQVEVAELLGISQNAYSMIERGVTRLTIDRIKEIANIFEIPYNDLFTTRNGVTQTYEVTPEQLEREKETLEKETEYLKKELKYKETIINLLEENVSPLREIIKIKEVNEQNLKEKIKLLEREIETLKGNK